MNYYNWGLAFQTLKDRNGNPLNAYNLYAQYDPALHPMPPTNRVTMPDRSIVDSGKPQTYEGYVNYLADLFKDRLHVMGGYRWTFNYPNGGQRASANPPWYNGTGNLYAAVDPSEWDAYGIGINSGFNPWVRNANGTYQPAKPLPTAQALGSYYQGTFGKTKGTSWMGGFSFDITPDISFYVSRSNSFRPSGGAGAIYTITDIVQRAGELGLNSQTEIDRIRNAGSDNQYGNELGKNTEFGFKTSLWDNKLVSTVSFFRLERQGEVLDDTARQLDDPLNWTGPNKTGTYARIVRWYSNGTTRRVEGGEVEVIWTPKRNYQVVASGSWLWKAKTLLDTSIAPTNTTALHYAYDYRMPGVSEYRFNMFNKYTFTRDYLRGLSVALGVRYASEMNIGNDTNWDSANGGLTAGDYVVFDSNLSYAWSLGGYKIQSTLNVTNLTDKLYAEGGGAYGGNGFSFSPPRTWMLTNTLSF
jgi:outer membrane receptor protein involved in Fe transport